MTPHAVTPHAVTLALGSRQLPVGVSRVKHLQAATAAPLQLSVAVLVVRQLPDPGAEETSAV